MMDASEILTKGCIGSVTIGADVDQVRIALGEPEHFEPARRSYPAFMLYGALEVRLRNGRVSFIGLSLDDMEELASAGIKDTHSLSTADISWAKEFLQTNAMSFRVDHQMSDDSQTVFVVSESVHLAFDEHGRLTRIAVGS
jgi:hypothetical protein